MTRIGITGHLHLTAATAELIRAALFERLRDCDGELIGVSCLAPGADSIFAEVVLALGGRLDVVLPARHYRDQAVPIDRVAIFDDLLARAASVRVMPYAEPSPAAYRAANDAVLAGITRLVAVWDGGDGDTGSTADAVDAARRRLIPIDIVWPAGARRSAE
ncbi:hypothetical protein [Nocardia xishanensis]|uniref:DUF1273 family protein n=1 Tax=Nocardia xishanensis TaxID=238964 RepID=A0ABW7X624_9NOCA